MEKVYINRDCCMAYIAMALHTLYHSANKEIEVNELINEVKIMSKLYTNEIELLENSKVILKKHGKSKIRFYKR